MPEAVGRGCRPGRQGAFAHGREVIGVDREQVFLMPPSVRDSVPEGHLVWTVPDAVGELDLSASMPPIAPMVMGARPMSRE
jgi:hypothetical protein